VAVVVTGNEVVVSTIAETVVEDAVIEVGCSTSTGPPTQLATRPIRAAKIARSPTQSGVLAFAAWKWSIFGKTGSE
jgi:hypothetical protein